MAAAAEGKGCSDAAEARAASMPFAAVRDVLPSMLDRYLHVPALLNEDEQAPARDQGHRSPAQR